MSKFSWTAYACISMAVVGVNMLRLSHDVPGLLQFTGGYLVASAVGIPLLGLLLHFRPESAPRPSSRKEKP